MFMSIAPRCALSPRRCKIYCVKKAPPRLYLPAQIYRFIGFTGSFDCAPVAIAPKFARPYQSAEPRLWIVPHLVEQMSHWCIRICHTWLSKRGDAMLIPDYIAIGVLIVLLVWAVADQVPRGKL